MAAIILLTGIKGSKEHGPQRVRGIDTETDWLEERLEIKNKKGRTVISTEITCTHSYKCLVEARFSWRKSLFGQTVGMLSCGSFPLAEE